MHCLYERQARLLWRMERGKKEDFLNGELVLVSWRGEGRWFETEVQMVLKGLLYVRLTQDLCKDLNIEYKDERGREEQYFVRTESAGSGSEAEMTIPKSPSNRSSIRPRLSELKLAESR